MISTAPFIKFKNFMMTRYLITKSSLIISSFTTNKSPFSKTVLSVLMSVLPHLCLVCVTLMLMSVYHLSYQCRLTCHSSNQMLVVIRHITADACVSLIRLLMSVCHSSYQCLSFFNFSSFNSCLEIEAHVIVSGGGAEAVFTYG
jgi:hypothetical protein